MRKREDVVYGFFKDYEYTPELLTFQTSREARKWRKVWLHCNPGPIFRITPPRTKPRKGRSK